MLTPQQINEIRAKSGLKPLDSNQSNQQSSVSSQVNSKNVPGRFDYLLGKQNEPGFLDKIKSDISSRFQNIKSDIGAGLQQESPIKQSAYGFSAGGQALGIPLDIIGRGMEATGIPKVVGQEASNIKDVLNAITFGASNKAGSGIAKAYDEWAQKHPLASKDLSALNNALQTALLLEGSVKGSKAVGEAGTATKQAVSKLASSVDTTSIKESISPSIMPELKVLGKKVGVDVSNKDFQTALKLTRDEFTGKELSSEIKGGLQTKDIGPTRVRTTLPTVRDVQRSAVSAKFIDPAGDKIVTLQNLENGIASEARSLDSHLTQNDGIFNKKQLASHLRSLERPVEVVADPTLSKIYNLAQSKFMSFVEGKPKNLSGLMEASREYSVWLKDKFPTLYSNPTMSPLKSALTRMRTGANDFIASHLPDASPFRQSLKKQNLLFEAVDNLAPRVANEVGSDVFQRFLSNNPGIKRASDFIPSGLIPRGLLKK